MVEKLQETIRFIKNQCSLNPSVGIILGSGLGAFASEIRIEKEIAYSDIPHFKTPKVDGHRGKMIFGWVDKTPVVCLQGRIHYYEGYSMNEVVYPMRTLAKMGVKTVFITNAAGGLDSKMNPGDFMIIEDHINLMGTNPLLGPNQEDWGPRFPDISEAYSIKLRERLEGILKKNQVTYHKGVYCGMSGPTYETPAEVRFLKVIGGSSVGMSTVPEVIVANHMGVKVCAISCITNKAAGLSSQKLSHEEVTATGRRVEKQFSGFVREFIASLNESQS